MDRRTLILAGLGLGALGVAEALRPRKKLVLLGNGKIADVIPREFGTWISTEAQLVGPEQAGRLAAALYSEILMRAYSDTVTGATVMLLIAYGDTQSDLLQLHRPESCYPAVGYSLKLSEPANVAVAPGAAIPARRVIAEMQDRAESIIYWTRLGERLPQSGDDQRTARLKNAMEGYVADGILVRCSAVGASEEAFGVIRTFVPQMLRGAKRTGLPALVGSKLSRMIA